jgi:mRNA interferase RelE/StbE
MTTYRIEYSRKARKTLKSMPRNLVGLVLEKIDTLALDPFASNNNVRKLTNHPGYRLRVGDWRVVYLVNEETVVIAVVLIAPRGEVYR